MTDEAIRDAAEKLRKALEGARSTTDHDHDLLEQLSADVDALLAEPRTMSQAEQQPMLDRFMTAVTRFEVSHPDLTSTLAHVSKVLADMGI